MGMYYTILVILFIIIILSLILNLLTSPITWIIIAALVIWSSIKRYLYKKQLEEFNKEFQRKTEEKRKTYYGQEQYYRGNEDIIDVDYKEYEDD
ncbi:hypothetical protein [Thomasclavelia cocleata]|uniref:hypothetical protein n=1 Tax=Thomasclavelia cocleata TaxID=69824 RepID=UPI002431CC68|nr:hypothetical protein [Thomasclavelia cocleata]